jgi:tripartite-type tricarboxylate transporter receptor subunit TctC
LPAILPPLLLLAAPAPANAAYPERSVRLVVGTEPGGSLDSLARLVAQYLSQKWGQPVVIENKPGANATISMDEVSHAQPDGYTLLFCSSNLTITPNMMTLDYDPVKSLAPVSLVATLPEIMVVNSALPVNSVEDLIALAKNKPHQLNFSSGGMGTLSYLGMVDFMRATGTDFVNVSYKSGASMITGILGNETQVMLTSIPSAGGNLS